MLLYLHYTRIKNVELTPIQGRQSMRYEKLEIIWQKIIGVSIIYFLD